jgi:hypothetical protein
MHNATVAEWILSLVAKPDRAASTVGDLVEEASTRGVLWFWSSVLRTAGSHLWHDLSDSPLQMLWLALWGVATYHVLSAMFSLLVFSWWRVDLYHFGQLVGDQPSPWALPVILVVVSTACPLLVGWEVGRRSPGRELPPAFAAATLFAALYVVVLYVAAMQLRRTGHPWPISIENPFTEFCAKPVFVVAGAILFRRRTLAKQKSAY